MSKIVLVAETGSDLSPALAARYNIHMVPMYVSFGDTARADGSFPPEEINAWYRKTGRLPKTSASNPEDFAKVFDEIHAEDPDAQILHLAYSAVTTAAYQNAQLAAQGRGYVTSVDTKQVTIGQAAVVIRMARILRKTPDLPLAQAVSLAEYLRDRARMCFLPDDLEFLRAGGRVSNVAYLGSRILSLHPCIEIKDGKLVATKKYRGKMEVLAGKLVRDYAEKYRLQRDHIWFVKTDGLDKRVIKSAENAAAEYGFMDYTWVAANGVITTHGGPGAFGLAGFTM